MVFCTTYALILPAITMETGQVLERPLVMHTRTASATVTASYEKGVLPEGVSLTASEYGEDDTRYNLLGRTLSYSLASGRALSALHPFDIHFTDAYGNEIEPDGTVTVTVTFTEPIRETGESPLSGRYFMWGRWKSPGTALQR